MKNKNVIIKNLLNELLLYSGQFGLFYIIMQIIIEGYSFLLNPGHISLLVTLVLQASLLSIYGDSKLKRVVFSFLVPFTYTIFELIEGNNYIFNAAHIGFWIYALFSSQLMVLRMSKVEVVKRVTEILLVFVNIFIFLFLYLYFDIWKDNQNPSVLTMVYLAENLNIFLGDPTHWFIIIAGSFLAVTIALGRYEIAGLKDKIIKLFGTYVDKSVTDEIISKGQFEAKSENLAVLFSDIKNFTSLCEKNDAKSIGLMLNIYFEYWSKIVQKYHGTIDKYIGDAIMVIFGLDIKMNKCQLAVECAMEAYSLRHQLYKELAEKNLPIPEDFGIGCHVGEMIIGDIGSKERKNFTVVGDSVNTASRLESVTRKTDSSIIISDNIYEKLDSGFTERFILKGNMELKGKSDKIKIYGYSEK